jgi:hypothetical protein
MYLIDSVVLRCLRVAIFPKKIEKQALFQTPHGMDVIAPKQKKEGEKPDFS